MKMNRRRRPRTNRKLGTPNFLCDPRLSRITSDMYDVISAEWARELYKDLHWSSPEWSAESVAHCLSCALPFLRSWSAVVSQKGESCSPVPEGECQ